MIAKDKIAVQYKCLFATCNGNKCMFVALAKMPFLRSRMMWKVSFCFIYLNLYKIIGH